MGMIKRYHAKPFSFWSRHNFISYNVEENSSQISLFLRTDCYTAILSNCSSVVAVVIYCSLHHWIRWQQYFEWLYILESSMICISSGPPKRKTTMRLYFLI